MNSLDFYDEIFRSETNAIQYLIENSIFVKPERCEGCHGISFSLHRKSWRCTFKSCRKNYSLYGQTFFKKSKLEINQTLKLAYFWLAEVRPKSLLIITGQSKPTITAYLKFFRQLVCDSLDFEDIVIGGDNVIVEIDESKFGKNKYHRGHSVNGAWILGGVERTPERKMFLCEVKDRTEETLLSIIRTHVNPGSIIMTDCFRSYFNLNEYYTHQTVNHKENFVNPENGACTNTIEGTWGALKYKIAPRNRTNSLNDDGELIDGGINDFFGEFQWRRKNAEDLWEAFLNALKTIEYIN